MLMMTMGISAQMFILLLGMSTALPTKNEKVGSIESPLYTNNVFGYVPKDEVIPIKLTEEARSLKKVFLSNRSITCNDGSQAGFYLRKSHASKKWIIFLEGGWYCYDHHSCRNRWLRQRHYMTSSNWPETRDIGGILSKNVEENPYWWNANHVFVPYCTSDSWSGTKPSSRSEMFSFMGSLVVQQVVKDILSLGLENATDLMLTGSSAGGTGVMINLDFVKDLLHDQLGLKQIRVKGVTDSGWFLDRTPFNPSLKPAVYAIKKGVELWQGRLPRRCVEQYKNEHWRCYFGYRLYPTLQSDLFIFQWLFDEAQMDADSVGAPVTKQQWDYIHKMGDALRQSFRNVSAVFAPSCISHSVLSKRDWLYVKVDDISVPQAIHCWEHKINRRRTKRRSKNHLQKSRRGNNSQVNRTLLNSTVVNAEMENDPHQKRKRRRKNQRNRKLRNSADQVLEENNRPPSSPPAEHTPLTNPLLHPPNARKTNFRRCIHRRLERCSWPQCNHSCPKLHDPVTGAEMDFIELLKSFGLDMDSMAKALGMDVESLQNMDPGELLNLLTQQTS